MLSKLFKYEFKATGRIFLPMYGILLLASVLSRLFFSFRGDSDLPSVLIVMVMVMLFTAVWVVTIVIILRRFWVNLLGREGYLTNVLPVHPWQHVFSKMITAAVWCILGMLVSLLAFLILLSCYVSLFGQHLSDLFRELGILLEELQVRGLLGGSISALVLVLFNGLFSCFLFLLMIYAAMCVGQLVNRHRVAASVGAYFGVSILLSLVENLLGTEVLFDSGAVTISAMGHLTSINLCLGLSLLVSALFSVALFFLSTYLLRRRLNLQ